MINKKVRAFFVVFFAMIVIFTGAHSDESNPKNSLKDRILLGFNSSNIISQKKSVEETFLGEMNFNGLGLVSLESTNFPNDLWNNSNEKVLSEKLNAMPKLSLASTNKIFKRLLLVDAKPPLNSIGEKNMGYLFLLSRIDQLIKLGAIDEAEEILRYIKEPSIEFMKRKIEVASLNGRLSKTCELANKYPNFRGMLKFKIICLVRKNDWQAAVLAFSAGSSLKQFNETEKQLLLNFLDPDITLDYPLKITINDLSPTNFYLIYGNKELTLPDEIPNKYAYAFSRLGLSPEVRVKSMEQLASNYVINSNALFNLYRSVPYDDKKESYDAKKTVLELDQSFESESEQKILEALIKATRFFHKKFLLTQLSDEYIDELKSFYFSNDKKLNDLAVALLSLSDEVGDQFLDLTSSNPNINCLIDIKKKKFSDYQLNTGLCKLVKMLNIEAIKSSFFSNRAFDEQMEKGLILLESLNLIENGFSTDLEELKLSFSLLMKIGLMDLVNEISLELIALDTIEKMVF